MGPWRWLSPAVGRVPGSRAAVVGEFGQRVESKGQAKARATGRAGTGLTCSPGGF